MGVIDWILGIPSVPNGSIDLDLRNALEKYVEENYGKEYVTQDELDEQKKAARRAQAEKTRLERLKKQAEAEKAKKEKQNSDITVQTQSSFPEGIRYSIPSDDDIEGLSKQADSYFSYMNSSGLGFNAFTPVIGFKELLLNYIIRSGMDNVEIYKRANISKSVFSSIMTKGHNPKKGTVIALAVALKLSLRETERLMMKAGYTFSNSIKGDLIAVYFINHKIYDIDKLNIALHENGQPLLGSRA